MADITMCPSMDCPNKANCYRSTAPVNELRQAYFVAPPAQIPNPNGAGTVCEMFMSNKGYHGS